MTKVRQVMPLKAPETREIRVAAYARVSSGKDAMLHSLSAQISYYSEFIQKHPGWAFAGVYADEAKTGTKDARPEFQRLLQDCRDGKIDMVITKAISRFARNTVTLLETTRELKALGIKVFFQKEGLYSDRGQGEMILTLLATMAQEESRAVSDNCKWRIRSRFKAGELVNLRFMYGYRISKGSVEIDPEEASVIAEIFDAYLSGIGCTVLARSLKERSVPTPFGGEWTAKRIWELLKNEKYAGNAMLQKKYIKDHMTKKVILNHGQMPRYYAEDTHPAIVSPEVFKRVQQLLEENRVKNNHEKKTLTRYPFTKKIECGNCGKCFTRIMQTGKARWQCATYLRKGRGVCPAKQIPEGILMSLVLSTLGLEKFETDVFNKNILKIRVDGPNSVLFLLRDGGEISAEWQDCSRSDSWTDEMKQLARERKTRKGH